MIKHLGRKALIAGLGASTLLVSACATETPYRPATGSGFYRTGYTDTQIEPNRFRVTFAGNSVTDRDTVERYLLFRAAELTVQNGYDYFVMADRDTDKQTRLYSTPTYGPGGWGGAWGPYGGLWGPRWTFYGRFGYRSWDPFWGGPWGGWGGGVDVNSVDRYEASAEIVMRRGQPEPGNVRAFNARSVISTIGPSVKLPKS